MLSTSAIRNIANRLPGLFLAIVFLSSCTAHKLQLKRQTENSAPELEQLISRDFNVIRNSSTESYLQNLKNRLLEEKTYSVRPIIARDDSVFALSFGAGIVLISSGLIESCDNESEFAFIIAHEYSHIEQDHFSEKRDNLNSEELKKRELQADSRAFELLYETGFSINSAISSISKFNSLHSADGNTPDYSEHLKHQPTTAERLENLRKTWIVKMCGEQGSCSNTGVRDSREFQDFKKGF